MPKDFTSLCVMSFERPRFLEETLTSLALNTHGKYELIVNDDASTNYRVVDVLYKSFQSGNLSKLILNAGKNRGIARSVHNMFKMAEGEYLYKLDADLVYQPDWLRVTNNILQKHKDVIMVGLFNYQHYDPDDRRFNILEERSDCYIVDDFVSSGFGLRHGTYDVYGKSLGADGWHLYLRDLGHKLAIPKTDVVKNIGFGIGRSTYVYEEDGKQKVKGYSDTPLFFGT